MEKENNKTPQSCNIGVVIERLESLDTYTAFTISDYLEGFHLDVDEDGDGEFVLLKDIIEIISKMRDNSL